MTIGDDETRYDFEPVKSHRVRGFFKRYGVLLILTVIAAIVVIAAISVSGISPRPTANMPTAMGMSPTSTASSKMMSPTSTANPTLYRGDTGMYVTALQMRLNIWEVDPKLSVDGSFGVETEAAVKAFQASQHLTVNGIVGPSTWDALNANPANPSPIPYVVPKSSPSAMSSMMS